MKKDSIQAVKNLKNIFGFYATPTPQGKIGQLSSHLPEISSPVLGLKFSFLLKVCILLYLI